MTKRTEIDASEFPRWTVLDCIRTALSAHKTRFNDPAKVITLGHFEYVEFDREIISMIGSSYDGVAWGCEIKRSDEMSFIEVSSD